MTISVDTIEPPRTSVGVLGWLKRNLFSTWYNSVLTIIAAWIIYSILSQLFVWMFTEARWSVITANWRLFMIGPYPPEQARRVLVIVAMVAGLFGLSAGAWGGTLRTFAIWLGAAFATFIVLPIQTFDGEGRFWLVADLVLLIVGYFLGRTRKGLGRYLLVLWLLSFIATILLLGGIEGSSLLPDVSTGRWGGLLLTFMLAIVSIVLSFPLGVLLALGRRSQLPAVKWFSVGYIEIVRGVPLVTVLYMTQIMLPLFLPGEFRIDNVVRAMAAFTLFTAAYMAENVRGGLQAIPTGQIEAAHALGLNGPLTTLFIVLPQALRLVIPATVGLFISLFKDTTLATIVALLELLGVGRSVLAQPEFLGLQTEVYLFVAAVFFVFSYVMSYASYQLEKALGVGKR